MFQYSSLCYIISLVKLVVLRARGKRILVLDEIFTVCHIINLLIVPNKAYVSFLLAWLDQFFFFGYDKEPL
jgi:hypothetical protein